MKLKPLVLSIALFAATGMVQAAITTDFVQTASNIDIADSTYNVYEMRVTTDEDWTNSRLDLTLTSGTIYNDSLGSTTEPNPDIFALAPTLEYDTYAAVPAGYPGLASFAETPTFSDTEIGASWFDSADDGAGTWTVAQITLSTNAVGTISGLSFDSASQGVGTSISGYSIEGGQIVPEPATLSLLAFGGVGMLLRRRRRE